MKRNLAPWMAPLLLVAGQCSHELKPFVSEGLVQHSGQSEQPLITRVALGELLFFDKRMSQGNLISCATCHVPNQAFSENTAVSHGIGANARRRNTPSLLNVGLGSVFDWDGHAPSLESQLDGVFSISGDMGIDLSDAIKKISTDSAYVYYFQLLYGGPPHENAVKKSIAAFERSLMTGESRFDRYYFNGDSSALTTIERQGLNLFDTKGACSGCHKLLNRDGTGLGRAPLFDGRFHNLGVGFSNGRMLDIGRYAQTRRPLDWGAFKTPTLRNVELTAPYMHDGSIPTLDSVVAFYSAGGNANPSLDPVLLQRNLTSEEQRAIVAFLKTLTSGQLPELSRAGSSVTNSMPPGRKRPT